MGNYKKSIEIIENDVVQFLHTTPKALFFLLASFSSGHLWYFVIVSYRRTNAGNSIIKSITGRTTIGFLWLTGVLFLMYIIKFGNLDFIYENVLLTIIPTIITGLFIQLLLFIFFMIFEKK
jgi:hypothetical protein